MCGIAGIIGYISAENRTSLKRMSDSMVHRGPDGEGFWESRPDDKGWGPMMAHRRLSILDLSAAGAQPMLDTSSGDVLVQNGEIYNYVELRNELAARGHRVQSSGDAEVLLRALSVYGDKATGMLRGMFAFAFWSARKRQLVLARDALGMKPLYLARNPDPNGTWSLIFASEVRAILASGLLGATRLNPTAVASVVWNGFTVAPEVIVQGLDSIWPGEQRIYSGSGTELIRERHWELPAPGEMPPLGEADLAKELEDTVRLHLASDVPLGVFLSGGVDSSAVANLAHKNSAAPLHTFTLTFDEGASDEGPQARRIANAIGTRHQEVRLTQQSFLDQLEAAVDSLDQPSFDGLNSYVMSREVSRAGLKVALVGSGGDELFGGYASFRDLPRLQRWARLSRHIPGAAKDILAYRIAAFLGSGESNSQFPPQTRWAKLPDIVKCESDLLALYQMAYSLFLPSFQAKLLANSGGATLPYGLPLAMRSQLLAETRGRTALEAISILESRLFLGERLLRDSDAVSMASSIEIRMPLVDQRLVTQMNRVPESIRYHPTQKKALLRRIGLKGLPPALFAQSKKGFELPYEKWMQGKLGDSIDETLNDKNAVLSAGLHPESVLSLWTAYRAGQPGLYWSRVWALFVLVRWCRRHRLSI